MIKKSLLSVLMILTSLMFIVSCEKEPVITSIEFEQNEIAITKGETQLLKVKVLPEEAMEYVITWASSDESRVTVDQQGKITAIETGNADITAAIGELKAVCKVTVNGIQANEIKLDKNELQLMVGESAELTATVLPEDAENKEVQWSTSADGVATVANGKVTAVAAGTATITAAVGEIKAECAVTVAAPAKVGDIYYTDGTYSTELDASKTPVAVVFWVGDPTTDDLALKTAHPGCIHGLALALTDTYAPWQGNHFDTEIAVSAWAAENAKDYASIASGYEQEAPDYLNKIMGYNNTKVIEMYNADAANADWTVDAILKLDEYRKEVEAPANTSGWYCPSAKEVSIMCTGDLDENIFSMDMERDGEGWVNNVKAINEVLRGIDGSEEISSSFHWSSTEYDNANAYCVYFRNGVCLFGPKEYHENRIRFVFAF